MKGNSRTRCDRIEFYEKNGINYLDFNIIIFVSNFLFYSLFCHFL